ncbi:MMPL family transporter [Mycobacterium angelicum]|uniref:Membrane transport protein MMPL domain-containing protein n=1 Tax=Mycobacterium angelicum TaxID=470074 RepID=A0A1X0A6D3_MYCAN|nr:MMPL family transporter [Mycobacterium angelicum]MCV7197197.1 MMPL family transporter [Mycobacterium angelicum]ORA25428.1 hypothetical protein BST12_03860 [Mycobacterium angelicum]
MRTDAAEPRSRLAKLVVIAAWIAVAVIANVVLTLTHVTAGDAGSTLLPQGATSAAANRIGQAFPGTGTNAIAYLVIDGRDTLGPADKQYYDTAVSALRADTAHVGSVLDWWSDPLTAPLGTGHDGRSGIAMLWLKGEAGSAQARQSLEAARSVVHRIAPSVGLRARIAVPETTDDMPLHMTAWQGAAIVAAAVLIAVALLLRAGLSMFSVGSSVGSVLLSAALSAAVAWPLVVVLRGVSVFAVTLGAVLAVAVLAASAMLVARREPDAEEPAGRYRDMLPALALPGACVALLTAPLLLARTPALHSVGIAAVSVVVALAASLTLLPALIGPALGSTLPPAPPRADGRTWAPPVWLPHPGVAVAVVLVLCALPVIGMRWDAPQSQATATSGQFAPGRSLPDVVVIKSDHDLRDPAGLIAIDAVSRRLMGIPGVRKVESAAWPAGIPWTEASLTAAAGRLGDQLDRQAVTFVPQVNAIKSLASALDQVTGAVNELQNSVTTGLAGVGEIQQVVNRVVAGTRNVKDTTVQVSAYLDPVRDWAGGVQNCPADALCSAARKVIDPLDKVVADVVVLSDGADRIAALSAKTVGAFASTPHAVAEMQSALGQLRSFVPTLERTVEETIPQVVQLSAFLRSLSNDFADTGEGGFYLSRKALADPSYQNVRKTMFSPDGTATRLFVFSAADRPARAQQLQDVTDNATKYGSLVDSQITLSGAAQVAATVRGAVTHDAVLLAATLFAVLALASMWRGALTGLVTGLGVMVSYLAALGISVAVWQYLLGHALHASVAPVSFAILAACGVPYLLARVGLAPLAALGAVFGGGLLLVSGASFSALGQVGGVVVIGVVIGVLALTAARRGLVPAVSRRLPARSTSTA